MSQKNGAASKKPLDKEAYQKAMAEDAERRAKAASDAIGEVLKKHNCALMAEPIFRAAPGGLYAVSGQVRVVPR
jgi:hypothetical protein